MLVWHNYKEDHLIKKIHIEALVRLTLFQFLLWAIRQIYLYCRFRRIRRHHILHDFFQLVLQTTYLPTTSSLLDVSQTRRISCQSSLGHVTRFSLGRHPDRYPQYHQLLSEHLLLSHEYLGDPKAGPPRSASWTCQNRISLRLPPACNVRPIHSV